MNKGYSNFQKKGTQSPVPDKKGYINIKNRKNPDSRYEISDEIMEDSGE
jgi:hypothetical protein